MCEVKKLFWLLLGLFAFLVRHSLRWAWKGVKALYRFIRKRRERPTHGDAHWASDKELKKSGRLQAHGFLACVTKSGKRVYTDLEANLLLIADRGMGKTLLIIAMLKALKHREPQPVAVQTPKGIVRTTRVKLPDIIISDPKLTAYNSTKADLEAQGYKVFILDLVNPGKIKYDPLSILNLKNEVDLVRQLDNIAKLLSPTAKYGKHDHFDNFPRIMIRGVLKHLLQTRPKLATLSYCVDQLLIDNKRRTELFKEMSKVQGDPLIKGAVDAFESAGDRERGSFITTNFEKLNYWLRPTVKAVTVVGHNQDGTIKRGWSFDDMFKASDPIAVFIRAGLGSEEGPLVRLIMGNAINTARRMFNQSGPLPKGLWVIVDEAITLGHCDAIAQVNRELREAGVNLMMCWLSYDDLKQTYPEHQSILRGCDWLIYGGSTEVEWGKRVSEVVGKTTAMSKSENESNYSKGKGAHEQGVYLLNQDEPGDLHFDDCIAILRSRKGVMKIRGKKPFVVPADKSQPVKYL